MLVKADLRRPIAFAVPIALLLAWRLGAHYFQLRWESYQFRNAVEGRGARGEGRENEGRGTRGEGRENIRPSPLTAHPSPLTPRPSTLAPRPSHWSGQLRVVNVFQET